MSEHTYMQDADGDYIIIKGDETVDPQEVCRRLNAAERLQELMAVLQDEAKDGPNEMGGPFVAVSIIAAALEEE